MQNVFGRYSGGISLYLRQQGKGCATSINSVPICQSMTRSPPWCSPAQFYVAMFHLLITNRKYERVPEPAVQEFRNACWHLVEHTRLLRVERLALHVPVHWVGGGGGHHCLIAVTVGILGSVGWAAKKCQAMF